MFSKRPMYSKRPGTSGIRGALYETKLLSLLYFRAIHDDEIENFELLSNVDNLGLFDDICFKAKVKGFNKPFAVFIHIRHRENVKQTLKIDLANYFNSYMKIREEFHPSNKDLFFGGTFHETECLFVIYTNAKIEFSDDSNESEFSAKLKDLIDTRGKLDEYEENINYRIISVEDQVTALAKRIAKFITGKDDFQILLTDDNVLRYHVILAQKVFDVSEIQAEGYRNASFRHDFYDTNEEYLILFKDTLFKEILKRRTITPADIRLFLSEFLDNPTDARRLSKLIWTVITYNNGQLQFDKQSIENFRSDMKPMDFSQSTVNEAVELAAKEILSSLHFKVPTAFGNKDLTIRGSDGKIDRRINYLASRILLNLLNYNNSNKMVTIDASLEAGFLNLNGGLAGAIGNIFVLDDNTKLLKITDNEESLGTHARRLYSILNSKVQNLHEYRFCFQVDNFPKLSFECIQIDLRRTDKQSYKHENNIQHLTKIVVKDQLTILAERIAKFVVSEQNFQMMLIDEHVLRYHVILAQKVFDVSEIKAEGYRMASFRHDFYDTNEEYLIQFKETLFKKILKRRTIPPSDMKIYLSEFLDNPTDARPLSKLIGTVVTYHNGQLEFDQSIKYFKPDVKPMHVSLSTVDKAVELATKEILSSLHFKVPTAFGNKDLTISGNDGKKERRINYLAMTICDLLYSCHSSKIVTMGEQVTPGVLHLNGGIAGAIGNIFVLDDDTKFMKITDNWESLGDLAKRLYTKLIDENPDLHDYKFLFKVDKFPKLSFGEYEESLVRDFLKKLHFYCNRANEEGVEKILKDEIIEKYQRNQPHYYQVQTDAIFSEYHNMIQKWWMRTQLSYSLTRENNLFQQSISIINRDALMNSINLTYMNKLQQCNYTFTEDAVRSLKLQDHHSSTVIVAENIVLTVVKVRQHLKKRHHVVLDVKYIATLPINDQNALRSELASTNEAKVLILVCDNIESRNEMKTLEDIAEAVRSKTIIIITKKTSLQMINIYFQTVHDILYDKKLSLIDLSKESQESIFKSATATFPGGKMKLDQLLRGWPKTGIRSVGTAVASVASGAADKETATGSH